MRRTNMYKAVRDASVTVAMRERIRIVHASVQTNHIHLLIEATNKEALTSGMQGFQISLARLVNTALSTSTGRRRKGRVFADRYHVVEIRSPRQARNVLSYVLSNWRKHREDLSAPTTWLLDPFSSAISFPDWLEREGDDWMWRIPPDHDPVIVFRPKSWLLREGWKRAGTVSARSVPSSQH